MMREDIRRALLFQAMAVASKGSEEKACQAYCKALLEVDVNDDISMHAERYAELLSVPVSSLMDAYYRLRPSYEALTDDVRALTWEDKEWPKQLDTVQASPRFLFLKGDASLLSHECISLIGMRSPFQEGKRLCVTASGLLGAAGFSVVSSLDIGIAGVALRSALCSKTCPIAVSGTQIDAVYPPEHEELQAQVARDGLLISRFSPAFVQQKWFLVLRNRLIAALSNAVVIVEEKDGGGSISQAEAALAIGRKVFLFQSTVDNPSLLWPREFAKKQGVVVVKDSEDLLKHLKKKKVAKPRKKAEDSGQLFLW